MALWNRKKKKDAAAAGDETTALGESKGKNKPSSQSPSLSLSTSSDIYARACPVAGVVGTPRQHGRRLESSHGAWSTTASPLAPLSLATRADKLSDLMRCPRNLEDASTALMSRS